MKPFLCIDLTYNPENEQSNGQEFEVKKTDPHLAEGLECATAKGKAALKRSELPVVFQVFQWITGLCGGIFLAAFIRSLFVIKRVPLSESFKNAPWLYIGGVACILIYVLLKILNVKKQKAVLTSKESTDILAEVQGVQNSILNEFSVPANAPEVDILYFCYKSINGVPVITRKKNQLVSFNNPSFKIFADSQNMYLANMEVKYAFPRSSFRAIHMVNETITMARWNKEQDINSEKYKPYSINKDRLGNLSFNPYYILDFVYNGEAWGICFPSYDLETFEAITGIQGW